MMTRLVLTTTPQQVSTGEKAAYLAVDKGSCPRFAISAAQPSTNDYFVLKTYDMSIPVGFSVWMWAPAGKEIEVVYGEGLE